MAEERLQKILRSAGITSRRKAEALILAGRVRVDGHIVTELGTKANPRKAKVELDGQRLAAEPLCYGVMHKPRGMVSTMSDPEGRPTASDVLRQVGVRVVPVGRLDFNTSGALLFSNDGDFAQALSHASGRVPKVYAAKVQQIVDDQSLARWAEAIDIEGKTTRPAQIRILRREGDKTWLEVTLVEGKNRQVRRLGEHAKTPVVRLSRLSHAEISAEGLRPGQWRLLSVDELKTLKKKFNVPVKIYAQEATIEQYQAKRPAVPRLATTSRSKPTERSPNAGAPRKPGRAVESQVNDTETRGPKASAARAGGGRSGMRAERGGSSPVRGGKSTGAHSRAKGARSDSPARASAGKTFATTRTSATRKKPGKTPRT